MVAEEQLIPKPTLDPELEAMAESGVHVGHVRTKRHPAMAPYLWGLRGNVEIIDLTKTKEKLAQALAALAQAAAEGKLILFVGTRPSTGELISKLALEFGYPYVNRRWIGGTLTNFKVILKRIEVLESLEQDLASGSLGKYTKREQLEKEKEFRRLVETFDGLRQLRRLPDLLVIMDIDHDELALREAERMKIPVVALTDTNTDPRRVTYPIPANDDARPAVAYMLERMRQAIRDGLAAGTAARAAAAAEAGVVSAPPNTANAQQ